MKVFFCMEKVVALDLLCPYREIVETLSNYGVSLLDGRQVCRLNMLERCDQFELIRKNDAIIVASYGTFSTGVNIRNLHNIIFASPSKSRVRNLQSIGRGLRIGDNKTEATLFDIADDFRIGKHANYTLKHFIERVKIYDDEKFNYKFYNIELKNA
jgi:hypothetical protein